MRYENDADEEYRNTTRKIIKYGITGLFIIIILFSSFFIVGAGERGVKVRLGNPQDVAYSEGLHFKYPFIDKIIKMDIKTQKYEADASSASRDLQIVSTKIAVNYHLISESTPELYKTIGLSYNERVTQPALQEVVKASTAQFTAEELITRRAEVKENIVNLLRERLQPRGIVVEDVNIVNFDFSQTFNEAIENKVKAEQDALAAKNKLSQVQYEAEQTITKAKAEAEALRLQKQEITTDLVKLRQIEVQRQALDKWDGKLPLVVGQTSPFIDVSSFVQGAGK